MCFCCLLHKFYIFIAQNLQTPIFFSKFARTKCQFIEIGDLFTQITADFFFINIVSL